MSRSLYLLIFNYYSYLHFIFSDSLLLLGVISFDIHPSNKLALSLGQNKTLRTWNLVKGRPAYTSNLARYCIFSYS